MTNKLIIDTDIGIDDAIAILMGLADPDWEIVGITAVSGNVPLANVLRNIGVLLDVVGAGPIPIFRGADRPLFAPNVHAASVHGEDGLGDVGFPASSRRVEAEPAAQALVRLARENPGATLLALGPLTNVALALALEPELPQLLGRHRADGRFCARAGQYHAGGRVQHLRRRGGRRDDLRARHSTRLCSTGRRPWPRRCPVRSGRGCWPPARSASSLWRR